ncbi:MAG: DUF488 family protein, partial [Xanthobacteraceae bacterium]
PADEFIEMLRRLDVGRVVDVRTIPRSRSNPQYNGETLGESLAAVHLLSAERTEPARLTPACVRRADGKLVYPKPQDLLG